MNKQLFLFGILAISNLCSSSLIGMQAPKHAQIPGGTNPTSIRTTVPTTLVATPALAAGTYSVSFQTEYVPAANAGLDSLLLEQLFVLM